MPIGGRFNVVVKWQEQMYADGTWVRQHSRPTPEMELIGSRFRRGRQQAGLSQRAVAEIAGVSQSEVSRLERGRGGGISTYRFVAIGMALGVDFPFGCCPHDHRCAYPRYPDRPRAPATEDELETLIKPTVVDMFSPEG